MKGIIETAHTVVNVISGIIDTVEVFAKEEDAQQRYRDLVRENNPFTDAEIGEMYGPLELEGIWQQNSTEYLYTPIISLYFPRSTEKHDVHISETVIDHGE